MTTSNGPEDSAAPAEATEADIAEQRAPLDPATDPDAPAAGYPSTDVEAAEGDLAEQAIAVPWDEDEQR
jgi:hypothetical protein